MKIFANFAYEGMGNRIEAYRLWGGGEKRKEKNRSYVRERYGGDGNIERRDKGN